MVIKLNNGTRVVKWSVTMLIAFATMLIGTVGGGIAVGSRLGSIEAHVTDTAIHDTVEQERIRTRIMIDRTIDKEIMPVLNDIKSQLTRIEGRLP